jgi:hypothetical protein
MFQCYLKNIHAGIGGAIKACHINLTLCHVDPNQPSTFHSNSEKSIAVSQHGDSQQSFIAAKDFFLMYLIERLIFIKIAQPIVAY